MAVDDEIPALSELAYLLRQDSRIEHVATAADGASALRDMAEMIGSGQRLDGVFLDVRMPGLGGLELAKLISGFPAPPRLVFVTAHDCALQAFELEAVDYLLKPVRRDRVGEAVRRLATAVAAPSDDDSVDDTSDAMDVIPVELGGRTKLVPRRSVWYVEAQGDYVRLHTGDGSYLVRTPLAALERRWAGAGFIRAHRSTLVNARHVSELRYDAGRVLLQVGTETLPVSRRHTRQVREQLVRQFRIEALSSDPPDADSPDPA
jgi:DNA-binding LytR/AlgR family response regulator